jgi:cytochrome c oxidase subunit 2
MMSVIPTDVEKIIFHRSARHLFAFPEKLIDFRLLDFLMIILSSPSMGTPLSPQADATRTLILVTVALASVIGLLVTGLVAYAVIRYRDRGTGAEPLQTGGNRKVEISYTLIPLAIQFGLFILTVLAMRRAEPAVEDRPPDLVIVAHQWWWELHYPGANVVTANEIHLPAGKAMLAELQSADVIHEVWVPQLGPKMDTVPGKPNHLIMEADRPGEYLGNCAEYCGAGHAWMRLRVIVQSPQDFEAWERQQALPPEPATGSAQRGRAIFQARTCIQCHAIQGLSLTRNIGPDLTHFASRQTLGAGVADNTPAELARWLSDPQAMKPGCYMPKMQLTPAELTDLLAYLEGLR